MLRMVSVVGICSGALLALAPGIDRAQPAPQPPTPYALLPTAPPPQYAGTLNGVTTVSKIPFGARAGLSPAAMSFAEGKGPIALSGAPCSVVGKAEAVTRFPDGNRIAETSSIQYYRDSQGRVRVERPGGIIGRISINDPVAAEFYMLRPEAKSADVMKSGPGTDPVRPPPAPAPEPFVHLSIGRGAMFLRPGEMLTATVDLGEKEINGVSTVGRRWEYTLPANDVDNEKPIKITVEQWFSPDLGLVVMASQTTSLGIELSYRVEQLTRAEPDPTLFTIPADYTLRDPMANFVSSTAGVGATAGVGIAGQAFYAASASAATASPPDASAAKNSIVVAHGALQAVGPPVSGQVAAQAAPGAAIQLASVGPSHHHFLGSGASMMLAEGNGPVPLLGAPYSVVGTTESITTFADGNRIVQTASAHHYRDGLGRTRVERPFGPAQMTTITDPVRGESYMVQPNKSYFVMQTPATPPLRAPASAPVPMMQLSIGTTGMGLGPADRMCTAVELGEKEIDGLRTVGKRWEYTVEANTFGNDKPIKITLEQWFSPDLGVVVMASQETSAGTRSTYRIGQLTRAEPDPALFTVPADYTRIEPGSPGTIQLLRATPKS